MNRLIDLRSDTVTQPTPAMRRVMAEAEVGDDVFGDDPTVQRLEGRVAELLGKEASLFMPSGTMSNQVALRTHTQPGDEVILEGQAHMFYYESGAPAALAGVMCRCLPGRRGIFTAADVQAVLRPPDVHFAPTRLVCIENTHNRGGGSVWPREVVAEVSRFARERDLRMHLDGARLWNASVATGVTERDYAAHFDSVSVCFSKGLGAPVGSALAGSREFIERGRRFRKQYGGGLRQAGILAAAALHALEHHRARLAEDHAHAQQFARVITDVRGVEVDPTSVQTNIVLFQVKTMPAAELCDRLEKRGVLMLPSALHTVRAVTHLQVSADDVASAAEEIRQILE